MSITLHHFSSAVCAAKVRIVLAEKGLEWDSRLVDLQRGDQWHPDYLALNPRGIVPTLVHNGAVVTESTVICEYLDDAFPGPPLRPATALGRARMRAFTKREDTIHQAVNSLTTSLVFRPLELAKSSADQAARIAQMPLPRRARWQEQMRDGPSGNAVATGVAHFIDLFRDMDEALASNAWLAGVDYSLADSGLVAFLDRLDRLGLAASWSASSRVTGWFARVRKRPSYAKGISEWLAMGQEIKTLDFAARDAILSMLGEGN